MIFISAQPDEVYFHWQVELYLYQFSKHGILNDCYALFGYRDQPSKELLELSEKYKNVKMYKDTREDTSYAPSIRPHLLKKFFQEHPELSDAVFYHDSDIFIVKMPNFSQMMKDDICYLSDTISYIGYKYISDCAQRYKDIHNDLNDDDVFYKMCECMNIDPELVKSNEDNSGGAQYLLKGLGYDFWNDCEKDCVKLYYFFEDYVSKYPIDHHIQKWTVDMWVVLWNCWKYGKETRIHKELDFSWAVDDVSIYHDKNIFHLAGITGENDSDKFNKSKYTKINVMEEYKKNPTIFNHISETNATYEYIKVLLEYINKKQEKLPINILAFLLVILVIFLFLTK